MSGNYAIIGAPGENSYQDDEGPTYIYRRNGENWNLIDKIIPNQMLGDDLINTFSGYTVASNEAHIIIGRPGCFNGPIFKCNPYPPDDFPGAVTILSNYIYPCDRIIHEVNYHPEPGLYPDQSAGTITLGGSLNSEVYFQVGVDIAYIGDDILLLDGFTAAEGSVFTAKGMQCSSLPSLTPGEYYPSKIGNEIQEEVSATENMQNNFSPVQKILIYPNPTCGYITIDLLHPEIGSANIKLLDVFGNEAINLNKEIVSNENAEFSINMSTHPKGLYLLYITTEDRVFTEKVILQ